MGCWHTTVVESSSYSSIPSDRGGVESKSQTDYTDRSPVRSVLTVTVMPGIRLTIPTSGIHSDVHIVLHPSCHDNCMLSGSIVTDWTMGREIPNRVQCVILSGQPTSVLAIGNANVYTRRPIPMAINTPPLRSRRRFLCGLILSCFTSVMFQTIP